jgi:hypothetical protein
MNNLTLAAALISDFACEAYVRCMPELTLTFNTGGDLARFEALFRRQIDAITAIDMIDRRPPREFDLRGLVMKLVVRHP